MLCSFLNFVPGNKSIIVIARILEWRQLEGKVRKARNILFQMIPDV